MHLQANFIRYRRGLRMPSHIDGCRRLSILVSGALREASEGHCEDSAPGSVALKSPQLVHRNRFGPDGATILSVILPDVALRRIGVGPDRLVDWRWRHDGTSSLLGLRLACALRLEAGASVEAELIAICRWFQREAAHPHPPGCETLGRDGADKASSYRDSLRAPSASRWHRVRRALETPGPPPDMDALARVEGVHPVTLARLFRQRFGCSPTRYRQRWRALSVARELLGGDDDLVAVALDHGFSDLSHMSRVFTREVGLPPGRFRGLLNRRSAEPSPMLESFKTEWSVPL